MSETTGFFTSASTPINTSEDDTVTDSPQYYSSFFLPVAISGMIVFLLILYLFQRQWKLKRARLQQQGRATLVQDAEIWSPVGLWSWRTSLEPTNHINRTRRANDSILEAGLDERGEAPPPYNAASADKELLMARASIVQPHPGTEMPPGLSIPVSDSQGPTAGLGHPLPGCSEGTDADDGRNGPARPPTVAMVSGHFSNVEVAGQPSHDAHGERRTSRVGGRGGFLRRLMSSIEGTDMA